MPTFRVVFGEKKKISGEHGSNMGDGHIWVHTMLTLIPGGGGGGVLPYMDYIGMCRCAAVKGMVFKQFTLG